MLYIHDIPVQPKGAYNLYKGGYRHIRGTNTGIPVHPIGVYNLKYQVIPV